MDRQSISPEDDRFLLIDEAAQRLGLSTVDLRQGIARGIVPMREDNEGTIRVHLDEVPADLLQRLNNQPIDPDVLAAVYEGELGALNNRVIQSEALRTQLEQLLARQGQAIEQSSLVLDQRDARTQELEGQVDELGEQLGRSEGESKRLADLLDRTFAAIEQREKIVLAETGQLTGTTDKAMELLQRALDETEKSTTSTTALPASANTAFEGAAVERLEHEITQRNLVIDNQQKLMERLVALSEKTITSPVEKPRKRSFWQRLWGGGKGI